MRNKVNVSQVKVIYFTISENNFSTGDLQIETGTKMCPLPLCKPLHRFHVKFDD